jgi:hypothetical protein
LHQNTFSKAIKNKTNMYIQNQKGISIVYYGFGMVLTQGWFPEEKAMVKKAFEK